MADRCRSTVLCSAADHHVFEKLGYRLDVAQALNSDGDEIPGAIGMVDDQAAEGHYAELTALKDVPFVVSNTARPGVFGDHLIASDGCEWAYAEALSESNYPAVRVNRDGSIFKDEVATARSYWRVYQNAIEFIRARARASSTINRSRS